MCLDKYVGKLFAGIASLEQSEKIHTENKQLVDNL